AGAGGGGAGPPPPPRGAGGAPAPGPPPPPGPGSGLIGLAERAALAGGRLTHHVDDSGRFHLDAWLPWSR
ncbi:sensor histidine kinase, partial [Micromonospora globbae]